MPPLLIERRLRAIGRRLERLRAEESVMGEQLAHFSDDAEDARIRAMVSETPLASADHRDAERHASAMARHHADVRESIRRLEAEQDQLLDRLAARRRG